VNLGLACRLCSNLGIDDVVLVDPQCERDIKEARMFANKARDLLLSLPVVPSLPDAVADCDLVIGTTARRRDADWGNFIEPEQLRGFFNTTPVKRIAVVFGNEADGLNNEELGVCQFFLTLHTWSDYYSYNLSHAMAIALYHCRLALQDAVVADSDDHDGRNDNVLATQDKRGQLYQFWTDSLERAGYFPEHKEEWRRKLFSRLFQRLPLTEKDCDLLRGMLAQYEKKKT
jgi:TrmH family RNA methyltransferase